MEIGSFISKEESIILQAIAAILMVFHHLFGFPDRILHEYVLLCDFSFFHFETLLSYFGRICIALYAFISGYGLAKGMIESEDKILVNGYSLTVRQAFKLYLHLWAVILTFVTYGIVNGIYEFNAIQYLKNLLGIVYSYNQEWWYIGYYLRFLLLFPVVYLILKRMHLFNHNLVGCIVLFFQFLAIKGNNSFMIYFNCFLLGMVCLLGGTFERLENRLRSLGILGDILAGLILIESIIVRIITPRMDFVVAMGLIFSITYYLHKNTFPKCIKFGLQSIGRYSTYIWLVHTFFAYYFWQKYIYGFKYSWIIAIVCIFLCCIVGCILEPVVKFLYNKVLKKVNSYD